MFDDPAPGISRQEPEQNADAQNDCSGPVQEDPGSVPHVVQDDLEDGLLIGRQLHDKQRSLALEECFLEEPGHHQGYDDTQ